MQDPRLEIDVLRRADDLAQFAVVEGSVEGPFALLMHLLELTQSAQTRLSFEPLLGRTILFVLLRHVD